MKHYNKIFLVAIASLSLLAGCQTTGSSSKGLDGTYLVEGVDKEDSPILTIDGNDLVVTWYGETSLGTLNKSSKSLSVTEGDEEKEGTYQIVGDKLIITIDDNPVTFKKQDKIEPEGGEESDDATAQETTESSKESEPKSTEIANNPKTESFFAKGEYYVGDDIEPGSYYVVLTKMEFTKDDEDDSGKYGYVSVDIDDSKGKNKLYESIDEDELGNPYRVTLEKGDVIELRSSYGLASWDLTFFTHDDFKEYQSSSED